MNSLDTLTDDELEAAKRILRARGWTVEFKGVPAAMYLVRSQSASGYAAVAQLGMARSTLYRSAEWKAYQSEQDAKDAPILGNSHD